MDSEPHKPPQTQSETGTVKFPHTMPMPMHIYTTMLIHGPDRGHWGTYTKQAVAATAGPTICHGVGDTRAVVPSPRHDARGRGRATRHRTRSAGVETGGACHRTSHPPQLPGWWLGGEGRGGGGGLKPRVGHLWTGKHQARQNGPPNRQQAWNFNPPAPCIKMHFGNALHLFTSCCM